MTGKPPRHRDDAPPVRAIVSRIDEAVLGAVPPDTVPTGFPSVDRMLGGGMRREDLVILAGDIGSGKSALGIGIAVRAALLGMPTVLLSGEMSEARVMERALALQAKVSIDQIRSGELAEDARAAVGAAAVRLQESPLLVRPLAGASFREIEEALDTVPRRALLVLDSVQLAAPPAPAPNTDESVAAVIRALKALAMDRNVAVLALAHLPGHRRDRPDPRPALDDLGGLGAVKQHADVVLAIYREEMYNPGYGVEGATELMVCKNRNGATGFVDLYFYRSWLRFEDMLDPTT